MVEIPVRREVLSTDDFRLFPGKMMEAKKGIEPGFLAWATLVTGVALYDYHAIKHNQQTMTQAFHIGLEHPVWKFMLCGALGSTALHLSKMIPPELDIYYGFGHINKGVEKPVA